jgi:hypothetical protein
MTKKFSTLLKCIANGRCSPSLEERGWGEVFLDFNLLTRFAV